MNKEAKALVENTFTSLQGAEVDIASTDPIPVPQDNGYICMVARYATQP